jgi:hypothetical protein
MGQILSKAAVFSIFFDRAVTECELFAHLRSHDARLAKGARGV